MKRMLCLALALVTLFASSCGAKIDFLEESFFSMDTFIYFKVKDADSSLMRDAKNAVYELEKTFSKTYAQSIVGKLNNAEPDAKITLSPQSSPLIMLAFELYDSTNGAYNPFLGSLIEQWDTAKNDGILPENDKIKLSLEFATPDSFTLEQAAISRTNLFSKTDLGGIAKGYAADNVVKLLRQNGISHAMLNLGGNIAVMGESESNKGKGVWTIGIKNPFNTSELCGTVNVTDSFISVSGAYERFFEKDGEIYHHIIDGKTGYPSQSDLSSVAIICPENSENPLPGALADALSTALFVMGKDKALEFYDSGIYDFEAILITKNGEIFASEKLNFDINNAAKGIGSLSIF